MPTLSDLFHREAFKKGADRSIELPDSPGTDLVLDTDIALLNGWAAVPSSGDGDSPARIYQQGGRAYLTGWLVAGTDPAVCAFPAEFLPDTFGQANADWNLQIRVYIGGNPDAKASLFFDGADWTLNIFGFTELDYVSLDGVSWALAPS